MKASNRLLLGFGVAIGLLVIVTVILALANIGQQGTTLLPENTPEGTVQRYVLALKDGDFAKAYSYLDPYENGRYVPYETWRQRIPQYGDGSTWKATLGKSTVKENEATVEVIVDTFRPGGPFENPVHTSRNQFLLKKKGEVWRISSPLYSYWLPGGW